MTSTAITENPGEPIIARKITPDFDTCDCGGGYPCSHGSFLYGVTLDEAKPYEAKRYTERGEPIPSWAYHYSEVSEFPDWLATMLLLGPETAENLSRCVQSLEALITYCDDPGTEALAAVHQAKALLRRLTRTPLDLEAEALEAAHSGHTETPPKSGVNGSEAAQR